MQSVTVETPRSHRPDPDHAVQPAKTAPGGAHARPSRVDLLTAGGSLLSSVERRQIGLVRRTFEPGVVDRTIRLAQRHVGANWIEASVRHLRHVYGLHRVPAFDPAESVICVSNHRSFFDLYVVTAYLVKRGMPHRLVFPVRSNFFYDQPLGLAVNGLMSFFAMYPPVFRDRRRAALNLASLDEVVRLLHRGGTFAGLHPEGTRNKGDDPYELLPAQGGVGRVIQAARVPVLPVFIHGLGNDFLHQITSNFRRTGPPVVIVFGEPISFGDLLDRPPSPRLHREISERALDAIRALGREEQQIRRTLT